MEYANDFSVIVPVWRGAIQYLPTLLASVPDRDGIEVIVVDNSMVPIQREEIESEREFTLLHSEPERHAGGSRNDGMAAARGRWLLFADADDYFTSTAFDTFYKYVDSDADIVFTCPTSTYADTGSVADRHTRYASLVKDYRQGTKSMQDLWLGFNVPWCKMLNSSYVVGGVQVR